VRASNLQRLLPSAPPSWALGRRRSNPVSSVSVTWDLSISTLQETAQRCVAEGKQLLVKSRTHTAPLGGLAFQPIAACYPAADGAGCKLCVGVKCSNRDVGIVLPSFKFQLVSASGHRAAGVAPLGSKGEVRDLFQLGVMAGGWDAVAVAAKGLPANGVLPITLTVSEVGHMPPVHAAAPAQGPVAQQGQ
jgi:hypothetical protein